MAKLAGPGRIGSMGKFKQSLKGSGGGAFIKSIPDGSYTVRFLTEPDEWYGYYEVWLDDVKRYVPKVEGMEIGPDQRVTFRYLANALDVDEGKVVPLKVPRDLANRISMRADRYGTITDRDYEITRAGSQKNTVYDITPEEKSPVDLRRFELHDLEKVLVESYESVMTPTSSTDEDDDYDDEPDEKPKAKRRVATKAGSKKKTTGPSREEMGNMEWSDLKQYAKTEGVTLVTKKRSELIAAIEKERGY